MAKLRLIGAVGIKVRPDASHFREDLAKDLRNLKDAKVKVDLDVDVAKAKRQVKEVVDGVPETLTIQLDYKGYDSIMAARRRVETEIRKLAEKPYDVDLDEAGLAKAKAQLEKMRNGARVDMKINQDEEGYKAVLAKIAAIKREKALVNVDFKTDNKSLDKKAAEMRRKLKELEVPRTITIRHRNDRSTLDAAIKQIDEALAEFKTVKIDAKLTEENLLLQRDALQKKLDKAPLELGYNADEDGYKALLKQITDLQRKNAVQKFTFKTDDASLAAAAEKVRAKLAEVTEPPKIKFDYDDNMFGIEKAIAQVDAQLDKLRQFTIEANLDEAGLLAAKAKLKQELDDSSFTIDVNTNDLAALKAEREKLDKLLLDRAAKTTIEVDANETSIEEAKRQLDELIKDKTVSVTAAPFTLLAAAQLAYTSRPRDVPFFVRVNMRSVAIAEGILQSLAGINVLREGGRLLEDLVTKFDQVALKTTLVSAALGSIADASIWAVTGLFPVAEGMLRVVNLALLAPAAIGLLTAGIMVNVAAWDNFKSAVDGSEEALAALPAQAQVAALAIRGSWEQIQEPTQAIFWRQMGTQMQEAFAAFIPVVRDGFVEIGAEIGAGTGIFFEMAERAAAGGGLETTLSNVAKFFRNANGVILPMSEAMGILGLRGSEYLPRFGQWLNDIAVGFRDWIQEADEAGKINRWIEQGIESLKQMGRVTSGTVKIFQGLTRAINESGAGNLSDLADELNRIGDIMKGEPFQSRMATIFRGANDGASLLNDGLKTLGETIGRSSQFVGQLLEGLGQIGGGLLTGIATTIGSMRFQDGILTSLSGMNEFLQELNPGFDSLGTVVGNLAIVAGAAFSELGPLVSQVMGILEDATNVLSGPLSEAIPTLISLVSGFFSAVAGPIQTFAEAFAVATDYVNDLDGSTRALVTSILPLIAMAKLIGPAFMVPDGFFSKIKAKLGETEGAARRTGVVMKGIGGGLIGALGGPFGIAIAAAVTGLSLYGQAQAKAAELARSHRDAVDQTTGAITEMNEKLVVEAFRNDKVENGLVDKLLGKSNYGEIQSVSETIRNLGMTVEDFGVMVARGGEPYEDMMGLLNEGKDAFKAAQTYVDDYGNTVYGSTDKLEAWRKKIGDTNGTVDQADLSRLITQAEAHGGAIKTATSEVEAMNTATSKGTEQQNNFAAALKKANDEAAGTDARVRGLKAALDILNGKQPDVDTALRDMNDDMRAQAGLFKDAEGNIINYAGVVDDASGKIDTVSEAGSNLSKALEETSLKHLAVADAMKQSDAPAADILTKLEQMRSAWVKNATASFGSAEEAEKAYDRMMGGNPGEIVTAMTLDTEGVELGTDEAKRLMDEAKAVPAILKITGDNTDLAVKYSQSLGSMETLNQTVATAHANLNPGQLQAKQAEVMAGLVLLATTNPTVKALMDPAMFLSEEQRLWEKIQRLSEAEPTTEVKAEIAKAKADLEAVTKAAHDVPAAKRTEIYDNGTVSAVKRQVDDLTARIKATPDKRITVTEPMSPGIKRQLEDLGYKVRTLPNGRVVVSESGSANVNSTLNHVARSRGSTIVAAADAANAEYALNHAARNRTAYISTKVAAVAADGGILSGAGMHTFANGGITAGNLHHYASGGFENHTAQIAYSSPSTPIRIWAEPETHGESYIPLSIAKRTRSLAIWKQTGKLLGAYADGGIVGGSTPNGSPINITINSVPVNHAQETADTLLFHLRHAQRGGVYSGIN